MGDIRKRGKKFGSLCGLICALIIFLCIVFNNIHISAVKIVDASTVPYISGPRFLVKKEGCYYSDDFETIESINSKYHIQLHPGDSALIVYKLSPKELSPLLIDIFFIIKL